MDKKVDYPPEQVVPVGVAILDSQEHPQVITPLNTNAFSGLSAFGFGFAVLNTWVGLVVGLGAGLAAGGPSARKLAPKSCSSPVPF